MWQHCVEKARGGDLTAFDELVGRFQDGVVAVALAMVGDFEDAQDVAQEAFIQAWRDLGSLRDPVSFPAWLMQIARNRSRDLLRRPQRPAVPTDAVAEIVPAGLETDPPTELARTEVRRHVLQAMQSLSEPNRLATTLFYINGYTVPEVAQFLGVPAGTVKRRLHDARKRLQGRMMAMVSDTLHEGKPGPELRARVAAELQARMGQWDDLISRWQEERVAQPENETEWARRWHEQRLADVRSNAAQYGIEPDEQLPRMLPEHHASETFRDDWKDLPRRWGIPDGLDLVNLRDLVRELVASPLTIRRWEQAGLPTIRYQPWVMYDRQRVRKWLQVPHPDPVQPVTVEQCRRPLLTVLQALAEGLTTAEEAADLYRSLNTAQHAGPRDPAWADQWDAARQKQRRANAALYGLAEPTDNWLGIPPAEERGNVCEVRDLSRRLGLSPVDVARWTRAGMPCLRTDGYVRYDARHVARWLADQGIMPARHETAELDRTELFVCTALAAGLAGVEDAYEALSGWNGVM